MNARIMINGKLGIKDNMYLSDILDIRYNMYYSEPCYSIYDCLLYSNYHIEEILSNTYNVLKIKDELL